MKKQLSKFLLLCAVLVLGCTGEVWGNGVVYMQAKSGDTGQGLVYCSNSTTAPSNSDYKAGSPNSNFGTNSSSDYVGVTSGGDYGSNTYGKGIGVVPLYFWAKPSRGYAFKTWTNPSSTYNTTTDVAAWNGSCDYIYYKAGGMQSTYNTITCTFQAATAYNVVYAEPAGGTYSVQYDYVVVENGALANKTEKSGTMQAGGGTWKPTANNGNSYATDVVTLKTDATNFDGWYESGSSTALSKDKTYTYTISKATTISPHFMWCVLGDATGDLTPSVTALGSDGYSITVPVSDIIGDWSTSDFTVDFSRTDGAEAITKGAVEYKNGTLTIPYTYNPTTWGGSTYHVTVTPKYGEAIGFDIAASAIETIAFEARIYAHGADPLTASPLYTGTLTEMMAQANTMDSDPLLQLTQSKTIDAPLSFTKSMTFDIYGNALTSTGSSAISIDAAGIDVKVTDGSYSHTGVIETQKDYNGITSVVAFTQAAKLTLNGGTMSAVNNADIAGNADAKAYGIYVSNGSVFLQSGGKLTVTSDKNATGVYVASASDYATLNGGDLTISSKTDAYGLWSAGTTNVANCNLAVETSTGTNAYGIYINGGITTANEVTLTAETKTSSVYGAYVKAGRLNYNGGTITATSPTNNAYGVHIENAGTAMLQQKAKVTATANATAYGINNAGTVSLNNATVEASATTTPATAVNVVSGAVATTIEDGSYIATDATGTVYGLHHQGGTLSVDGGTFKGIATNGNSAYGVRSAMNGTIANATMWGETQGAGNTAYGFVGGVAGKTVELNNCDITGKSATKTAYGIYSRAIVTATDCRLTALTIDAEGAYGFKAENGTNVLNNCTASVEAYTTTAYGIIHNAGSLTVDGGIYSVEARQVKATAAQNAVAYGLYSDVSATTTNVTFSVTASNKTWSQNVYGAFVKGTLTDNGSTFNVEGRQNVYGVYGSGSGSNMKLTNTAVSAETTNGTTARGMYAEKYFTIDGGAISAKTYSSNAYAMQFTSGAQGTIDNGAKFSAVGNESIELTDVAPITNAAAVGKVVIKNSYYVTTKNLARDLAAGYSIYRIDGTVDEYAQGYRYAVATEAPCTAVCHIGGTYYTTLEAAMQYAIDHSGSTHTIIMTQNYTLPAGSHRLPSNAKLLIPYKESQTTLAENNVITRIKKGVLEEYIRLTIADGANWDVDGTIEVGGEMFTKESPDISYIYGPYGRMHLEDNALVQLNGGAYLYAWGYVTGKGNIKAKNNAEVHEMFQLMDMKPMSALGQKWTNFGSANSYKYFPVNQYSIQNIEAPVTYYYNSRLICAMQVYYSSEYYGDKNIKLVGTSGSLFQITTNDESTWVRKSYDATTDQQVWDISSSAELGSLKISIDGVPLVGTVTMNSADYILPITNNMKLHILKGANMTLTQSTTFLPGTDLEIDLGGSVTIPSGQKMYVMDKDQWPIAMKQIVYSPSWSSKPTRTSKDAAINVHGSIIVNGQVLTSKISGTQATDGANIFSNNADAGTVSFRTSAPADDAAGSMTVMTSADATSTIELTSAKLKNGDGTYTTTAGATSGTDYGYLNDAWHSSYVNGPFTVIDGIVYAKPSEYVQLKQQQTGSNGKLEGVEESNHTYITINDDILILQGKGTTANPYQWWEVEATATAGVFECKKTGYEGFYSYNATAGEWQLVKRNVTFYLNEEKTSTKVVSVNYMGVPDQSVIATNPVKATTAAATYSFKGWKSSVTNTEYAWTATLEPAENDMFYTPVFTENPRKYTITFVDANNGASVPVETEYGTVPSYEAVKAPTAQYTYTFTSWTPTPVAVTGAATYTANWDQTVNLYTITWKDGETVLKTDKNQAYGIATTAPAAPTKEADNQYAYTFDGWTNSLTGAVENPTGTVAGNTTYTAHYATTPRYMITFVNFDGEELQKTAVTQGEVPAYAGTPRRDPDRDGYFKFTGWKNSDGTFYAASATLPAASKKETYTAQWEYVTTVYTITFKNFDGNNGTWSNRFGEGETPSYDGTTPLGKASTVSKVYTLDYWVATSDGAHYTDPLPAVTAAETYTAVFAESARQYTITWKDGNDATLKTEQVDYDATPAYTGATPTKASTSTKEYTFNNTWNPAIAAVAGDATYTAQFDESDIKYDITWIDGNGTIIYTERVAAGATPAYTGATPTKTSSNLYDYTFSSWSPAIVAVTGDAVYRAQFTPVERKFTITFKNGDAVFQETQYTYGETPVYSGATPEKTGYIFTGWSPAIASVSQDQVYTAQFAEVVATVTSGSTTTPYSDFATALNAAKNCNGTLTMMKDVNYGSNTVSLDKDMTWDLNGKTFIIGAEKKIQITSSATVTIMDGSAAGNGNIYMSLNTKTSQEYVIDLSKGTLNFEGGTINAYNTHSSGGRIGCLSISGSSILNMKGGKFNCKHSSQHTYNIYMTAGTVNVSGGEMYVNTPGSSMRAWNIYMADNSSKVNVSGGVLTAENKGTDTYTVSKQKGTLTVTGGKHKVIVNGSLDNSSAKCFNATISNVSGGYFSRNGNITAAYGKKALTLASDHPEYANGYRYVVETAHKVTWDVPEGVILSGAYTYGETASGTPITKPASPTRNGYTFAGWDKEVPATMPTEEVKITATWVKDKFVADNETVSVDENTQVKNVTVTETGKLSIDNNTTVTVLENLYLAAIPDKNEGAAISGTIKLVDEANAYIDIELNGSGSMNKSHYYSFAVPFSVDINGGVFRMENGVAVAAKPNTEFRIWSYSESVRAAQGKVNGTWEQKTSGTLEPGVFYLMQVATNNTNTYRFQWNKSGNLNNAQNIAVYTTGSDAQNSGWQGIANNGLDYATMSGSFSVMQTLNSNEDKFEAMDDTDTPLAMAKPVFVQTGTSGTVTLAAASAAGVAARRAQASEERSMLRLQITKDGEDKRADQVFFGTSDEALDEYEIGKDVAKMFMGTAKTAQVWINAYDNRLVANEAVMVNNRADFALTMFTPAAADYELNLRDLPSDAQVVLLQGGVPVADLTLMPYYTVSLAQGETADYSLAIVRKTPSITTGTEQAGDVQQDVQKIFFDGKLYIVTGERVYDAQGKLVK